MAKAANVLLSFGCHHLLVTLPRNCGKTLRTLFLFLFFGAFQIVLLYLFSQSIIAADVFLNLIITNPSEALELLDNLTPAIIAVITLYVPALILRTILIICKWKLTVEFIRRERKRAFLAFGISLLSLVGAYVQDSGYESKSDLYPPNVCYNVSLAFQRAALTQDYHRTSKDFTLHTRPTHPEGKREVYAMVIGETSYVLNWQLYGCERETNPFLPRQTDLIAFSKMLTEPNTTHKSVPMPTSDATVCNYDSIYHQGGIIIAFKEVGFQAVLFSNQHYNHSFTDFFGMEANTYDSIKEDPVSSTYNPSDDELLKLVEEELAKGATKQFIILHIYDSHFNYRERYPLEDAFFTPDYPMEAERKYRSNLVNVYNNSIRYTDGFLSRLIRMLEEQQVDTAVLHTSDHEEDIFDDSRHLFLHASSVPSYHQFHMPLLIWMSNDYHETYPERWNTAIENKDKNVSSSSSFFPTILFLGGIETPYRDDSQTVTVSYYVLKPRVYLNDHNDPRPLDDLGMKK